MNTSRTPTPNIQVFESRPQSPEQIIEGLERELEVKIKEDSFSQFNNALQNSCLQPPPGRHSPQIQTRAAYFENLQPHNVENLLPDSNGNLRRTPSQEMLKFTNYFEEICQPINNIPPPINQQRRRSSIAPCLQSMADVFNSTAIEPNFKPHFGNARRRSISPQVAALHQLYTPNEDTINLSLRNPTQMKSISHNLAQRVETIDTGLHAGRQRVKGALSSDQVNKYFHGVKSHQTSALEQPVRPRSVSPQPTQPESPDSTNQSFNVTSYSISQNRKPPEKSFETSPRGLKINFYSSYKIQAFLQRIVLIQNHLRSTIESGDLISRNCLINLIREQFGELLSGDIVLLEPEQYKAVDVMNIDTTDGCLEDRYDLITSYNLYKSIFTQMERTMPPLSFPDQKPYSTLPELMSFDEMVSLYNGLKLGFSIVFDKYEFFSSKLQFENTFNLLFDGQIFMINPNWCDEDSINRQSVINFMYRITKLLKYLSFFMNKSELEYEEVILNTISEGLQFTNEIEEDKKFMDAFQLQPAECRKKLLDMIGEGIDFKAKRPDYDPNSCYMSYEKMQHLYEGLEAAFWMICDELERKVYADYQIFDAINSALQNKFDVFINTTNNNKYRDVSRGAPLRNAIQRMVVFLGIIRRELQGGRILKTKVFNYLKKQLLFKKCSTILEKHICMFRYIPENSTEIEINRLIPILNLPNSQNIPIAKDGDVGFYEILRFYFRIKGGVLRFLRYLENDLFVKAIEDQNWVDNRVKECQIIYVSKDEGDYAPNNSNSEYPRIQLDPIPDDYDTIEYLRNSRCMDRRRR